MGYSIQSAERGRGCISTRKRASSVGVADAVQVPRITLSGGDGGTEFRVEATTRRLAKRPDDRTSTEDAATHARHDAAQLKRALLRVSGDGAGAPAS